LLPLWVLTGFPFLTYWDSKTRFQQGAGRCELQAPGKIELNHGMTGAVMLLFRLHF
jgi:hypothetical protein